MTDKLPPVDNDLSFVIAVFFAFPLGLLWLVLLSMGGEGEASLYAAAGLLGGPLSIAASLCDWDWFFHNKTAWPVVRALGRGGARLFYVLLGALLTIIGYALLVLQGLVGPRP